MINSFRKMQIFCFACGGASWVFALSAALAMSVLPNWVADGLSVLWVASALGAVVLGVVCRFLIGIRKSALLRWGMIFGVVMLFVQGSVFGVMMLQQKTEWESSSVALVSFASALGISGLSVFLYCLGTRIGQARLERASAWEEKEGDR